MVAALPDTFWINKYDQLSIISEAYNDDNDDGSCCHGVHEIPTLATLLDRGFSSQYVEGSVLLQ